MTQWIGQAASVPILDEKVCLITSRRSGRWVVPKGMIDPGNTAGETALMEAWEEAGLVGVLDSEPAGTYVYAKWDCTCHVTVFRMDVTEVHDEWDEQDTRRRIWMPPREAIERVEEDGLREIIRRVTGRGNWV